MKTRTGFPLLLILLVAISLVTTRPASAVAPDHRPLASGEGAFSFFNGFRLEQWFYTFEAETSPSGKVHGQAFFELADTDVPIVTHITVKINCLNVLASPESVAASIQGTVIRSDDPEFPKRANVVFGAEDNDASIIFLTDTITRPFVFQGDCSDFAFPLTSFSQSLASIHIEP